MHTLHEHRPFSAHTKSAIGIHFLQAAGKRESETKSDAVYRFLSRIIESLSDKWGLFSTAVHFSGPKGRRFKSCHLDQKTAGNLRISGFFLCNLHKDVSLAPFPCNYFATFQNVPKGRKDQHVVVLQFLTTTYCIFLQVTFWLRNKWSWPHF